MSFEYFIRFFIVPDVYLLNRAQSTIIIYPNVLSFSDCFQINVAGMIFCILFGFKLKWNIILLFLIAVDKLVFFLFLVFQVAFLISLPNLLFFCLTVTVYLFVINQFVDVVLSFYITFKTCP